MGLREWLVPQEKVFFEMLEQESKNVVKGAELLQQLLTNPSDAFELRKRIKEIEEKGDDMVHQIYEQLHRTFITPIDQEDIARLASLYDDVLDFIYAVANRLFLYEVKESNATMEKFSKIVTKAVAEVDRAFSSMQKIKSKEVHDSMIEVERFENEADELLNESVAALFREQDIIKIIKLKEIYEILEVITDKCADVGTLIRDIVLKYT